MSQKQVGTPKQLSSQDLIDIETPFRVRAGPGAGKTHWLIGHIKNVLQHSRRLGPASRIGCISYTEVAASEILARLGDAADRVDVSTIHSFLYRNIVRPYVHLLRDKGGAFLVAAEQLDGHDKHHPSVGRLRECIKPQLCGFIFKKHDPDDVVRYLAGIRWTLDGADWKLSGRSKGPRLPIPAEALMDYKRSFWTQGVIHHDDVLYFAHQLLGEYPELRKFLSARYPYVFIDEFQDTTPAQTKIVEWLSEQQSIVGVIGDPEQSIYEFTGARPQDFDALALDGCAEYEIRGNRRSTPTIVSLLNTLRKDGLKQESLRDGVLLPVVLYVGPQSEVLAEASRDRAAGWSHATLLRANDEVHAARLGTSRDKAINYWEQLAANESNRGRLRLIRGMAEAYAHLRRKRIGEAVRVLSKTIKGIARWLHLSLNESNALGLSVSLLEHLLGKSAQIESASLLEVYTEASSVLSAKAPQFVLSKYAKGKPKEFAESTRFVDLVFTSAVSDEHHEVRTIHSAKGAEFDSVFVWLEQENLRRLLLGDASSKGKRTSGEDEERRVLYVALSRARRVLALGAVGPLSKEELAAVNALGIRIVHVSANLGGLELLWRC